MITTLCQRPICMPSGSFASYNSQVSDSSKSRKIPASFSVWQTPAAGLHRAHVHGTATVTSQQCTRAEPKCSKRTQRAKTTIVSQVSYEYCRTARTKIATWSIRTALTINHLFEISENVFDRLATSDPHRTAADRFVKFSAIRLPQIRSDPVELDFRHVDVFLFVCLYTERALSSSPSAGVLRPCAQQ